MGLQSTRGSKSSSNLRPAEYTRGLLQNEFKLRVSCLAQFVIIHKDVCCNHIEINLISSAYLVAHIPILVKQTPERENKLLQ